MLIFQREGLGMYLCLINGGGGGIFAVNKLGVISQNTFRASSPALHIETQHRDYVHTREKLPWGLSAATLSKLFIYAAVLVVRIFMSHTQ